MKTRLAWGIIALLTLATSLTAGPRDAQWREVEDARHKGLPKTAIEKLEVIIRGSMADRADAEAIKAIGLKIALEAEIQGNKAEEKILRMQAESESAPAEDEASDGGDPRALVLAVFPGEPLAVHAADADRGLAGTGHPNLDLARILAEIDRHFTAALANEGVLKATPVADYNDLLRKGSAPTATGRRCSTFSRMTPCSSIRPASKPRRRAKTRSSSKRVAPSSETSQNS